MSITLKLVPEEAAASIAARIKTIQQCEQYIREVVARYDGLKAFEKEIERHGVASTVAAVVAKAQ